MVCDRELLLFSLELLERAPHEHASEMRAIVARSADVSRRLGALGGALGGVCCRGAVCQRLLDGGCPQRRPSHAREPDLHSSSDVGNRDTDGRPVARRALVFEIHTPLDRGEANLGEQLVRLEGVRERPGEELRRRNRALTVRPARDELRIDRDRDGAEIGRRVRVRKRTSEGPPMPNLRVADELGRVREQRASARQYRVANDRGVAGESADGDPSPSSRT